VPMKTGEKVDWSPILERRKGGGKGEGVLYRISSAQGRQKEAVMGAQPPLFSMPESTSLIGGDFVREEEHFFPITSHPTENIPIKQEGKKVASVPHRHD